MLNANQSTDNMSSIIYFTPLYNTEFDFDQYEIIENSKIRKFSEDEKKWFEEFYKNYRPVLTNFSNLTHILEIKIDLDVEEPGLEAKTRINVIILLKISICELASIDKNSRFPLRAT